MSTDERPYLDGGGDIMDWTLSEPFDPDDRLAAFTFTFERDDGSGQLDHVHVPVAERKAVVEFMGGIDRDDVLAAIRGVRDKTRGHDPAYVVLERVIDVLGLGLEGDRDERKGSDGGDA